MPTRDRAPAGSPCWTDLWTSDVEGSRRFYSELFGWEAQEPSPEYGGYFMFTRNGRPVAGGMGTDTVADNDEFRYSTMRDPGRDGELAGIMDVAGLAPDRFPSKWAVYWEVEDVDTSIAKLEVLGGAVVMGAEDTPYGRIAVVADPSGASFRLRTGGR